MTVAAIQIAGENVWTHVSYRMATRRPLPAAVLSDKFELVLAYLTKHELTGIKAGAARQDRRAVDLEMFSFRKATFLIEVVVDFGCVSA